MRLSSKLIVILLVATFLSCEKKPPTLFENGYYNAKTKHFYFIDGFLGVGELDNNDKFEGSWMFFDTKGILIEKAEYKQGIKDGYSETYISGELVESGYYRNGVKIQE